MCYFLLNNLDFLKSKHQIITALFASYLLKQLAEEMEDGKPSLLNSAE